MVLLHLQRFIENVGKCRLSTLMLNFLVVAKKHTNLVHFGGKIVNIPWLWPIVHVSWLFHDHSHFPGFPVSVGALVCICICMVISNESTRYFSLKIISGSKPLIIDTLDGITEPCHRPNSEVVYCVYNYSLQVFFRFWSKLSTNFLRYFMILTPPPTTTAKARCNPTVGFLW